MSGLALHDQCMGRLPPLRTEHADSEVALGTTEREEI